MISGFFRKLPILLVLHMLVSCTMMEEKSDTDKVVVEPSTWAVEKNKRKQIVSWEIRGRLGIQTENNGGTMDIIWKQAEQNFTIRLIAPMGTGTYLVKGDSDTAEIRYPDGDKKIIHDIDQIFSVALGVDLPAGAVKDWLRGLPAETLSVDTISWNDQGLLNTIKQSGWNVEMKKYSGTGTLLPHAIYLSRDDSEDLDIRLLLRQWIVDQ